MKYDDLVRAIKEDEEWENELKDFVDGHGDVHTVKVKKIRHGKDLDALDGMFWYRMLSNHKDIIKSRDIFIDNVRIPSHT